jgi:hypothetical protein
MHPNEALARRELEVVQAGDIAALGNCLRVVSLAGVVEERMIGTGEDANLVMPVDVPRCDTSRWSRWLAARRVTCKIALVLDDGAANLSIACVVGSTSISMLR